MSTAAITLGQQFKPSLQLRSLYYAYLGIISCVVVLPWYIPLLVMGPLWAILAATVATVIALVILLYWIPRYYHTIFYTLTETEIVWRRGVWFRNTGIVPYNRITNVDIGQGPISRKLGIAALKVQTAGYSGQQSAEIRLEGIENSEELRETIMSSVRGRRPEAVETYGAEEKNVAKILAELTRIRELIERFQKKME